MGGLSYDKWDKLEDSDDEGLQSRAQAVRKQATTVTEEEEAQARKAAQEDCLQLLSRTTNLQEALEARLEDTEKESGEDLSSPEQEGSSSRRRRARLDVTREVEVEKEFEARPAPDGGRGKAIAAELRSYADLPPPPLPKPGEPLNTPACSSTAPAGPEFGSTLRRLKQLDCSQLAAITRVCGVRLNPSSDAFRLVLSRPKSALWAQTKVLFVSTGEAFLCQEPPEVLSAACAAAEGPEGDGQEQRSESPEPPGGTVEINLRYFRASPKLEGLAKRVGIVPTLHVRVSTSDGLKQAMEFIGVHQRRYYEEQPPSDAISQNLVESLLRVALEFIFHPSRSRYTRPRVVLRECSEDAEAAHSRESLLPAMAQGLKRFNEQIKEVVLDLVPASCESVLVEDGRRHHSFLILDEDVLKVAPSKEPETKAPSAKGAFKGLSSGFLNSEKVKQHGFSCEQLRRQTVEEGAVAELAAAATAASSSSSVSEKIPVAERTRMNTLQPARFASPPGVQTDAEEKRRLLLPAADLWSGEEEARATAAQLGIGAGSASAPVPEAVVEEDEDGTENPGDSLSELANRLFGPAVDLGDLEDGLTESTEVPSPKAASSRDDRAPSEQSEAAGMEAVSFASMAPVAGLRLLQQRRRDRGAEDAQAPPPEAASEGEDLVKRWMAQRW